MGHDFPWRLERSGKYTSLETASIGFKIQAALLIGVTAILLGKAELMFSESTPSISIDVPTMGDPMVVSGHLIGRLFQHGQTNHI